MIKKKLSQNAKKIDKFLIKYLKNQKHSLLIKPNEVWSDFRRKKN